MTKKGTLGAAVVVGLTVAVGLGVGCTAETDLGVTCFLVRKDPNNPSGSVRLKEKEVAAGKDFISFGATECEDLVCVRDANAERGQDEQDATGFCSRPCLQTNEASCLTGNSTIDDGPEAFTCRALVLDEQTLAAIKQADPEKYRQYFGGVESPYFCARPTGSAGADGGT